MALDVEKAVENAIEKTLEEGQGEESKESEESKEIKEAIAYTRSWKVSSTKQEKSPGMPTQVLQLHFLTWAQESKF